MRALSRLENYFAIRYCTVKSHRTTHNSPLLQNSITNKPRIHHLHTHTHTHPHASSSHIRSLMLSGLHVSQRSSKTLARGRSTYYYYCRLCSEEGGRGGGARLSRDGDRNERCTFYLIYFPTTQRFFGVRPNATFKKRNLCRLCGIGICVRVCVCAIYRVLLGSIAQTTLTGISMAFVQCAVDATYCKYRRRTYYRNAYKKRLRVQK